MKIYGLGTHGLVKGKEYDVPPEMAKLLIGKGKASSSIPSDSEKVEVEIASEKVEVIVPKKRKRKDGKQQ